LVNVQMPDAASAARTRAVVSQIEEIALQTEGVHHAVAISGQSILLGANASNFGALYLMLKPFEERRSLSSDDITARLQDALQQRGPRADVNVVGAAPVEGVGTGGGSHHISEKPRTAARAASR